MNAVYCYQSSTFDFSAQALFLVRGLFGMRCSPIGIGADMPVWKWNMPPLSCEMTSFTLPFSGFEFYVKYNRKNPEMPLQTNIMSPQIKDETRDEK